MTHYHVIAKDTETGERQLSYEVLGDKGLRPYTSRKAAQLAADDLWASAVGFGLADVEYDVTDDCIYAGCEAR